MALAITFITGLVTHSSNQRLIIHVDSPEYNSEAFLVAIIFEPPAEARNFTKTLWIWLTVDVQMEKYESMSGPQGLMFQ